MAVPQRLPKFQKKIQSQIDTTGQQVTANNLGVILAYDPMYNTASVMLTARGGEGFGEIYKDVPCPRPLGIQSVAPGQGCQCLVQFKDNKRATPIIAQYLNTTNYQGRDYAQQNYAINNTPTFISGI